MNLSKPGLFHLFIHVCEYPCTPCIYKGMFRYSLMFLNTPVYPVYSGECWGIVSCMWIPLYPCIPCIFRGMWRYSLMYLNTPVYPVYSGECWGIVSCMWIPLYTLYIQGHVEGARELIKGGALPAGADKEGFTPLHR